MTARFLPTGARSNVSRPLGVVAVVVFCLSSAFSGTPQANGATQPVDEDRFTREALADRLPATRVESYAVNVRIRPLLLFWMGRDNVGEATLTWREGVGDHRAYEFLIGSDPARVPRHINRWGFIVEELNGERADVLGIMKESGEQTIEEAKANVEGEDTVSTFKAARTTIAGNRAVSGIITMQAPSSLTYRDLDELLALVPAEAPDPKTIDLPTGTKKGFLVALESLMRSSIEPCRADRGAKDVPAIRYLYNQTIFDLSLESCTFDSTFRTKTRSFSDVVDGRFRLRNSTTKNATTFRIVYGTSGDLHGIPLRMVFRPRWWMEIELELARSPEAPRTSAGGFRR